eukprot:Gb_27679 [translate_table: standard]
MSSIAVLRNIGNRLNSGASLLYSGFCPVFHEINSLHSLGFSSTVAKENVQKQTDGNSNPKLERIADELLSLTKLERHDFSILFKLKLGIDRYASPMMGMSMTGTPGGAQAAAEQKVVEKTVFDIKLEKYEATAKIKIIKEVRGFTDLGLKEAKELVEKTPAILKKGLTKEEATQIIEKLKELGATVVME